MKNFLIKIIPYLVIIIALYLFFERSIPYNKWCLRKSEQFCSEYVGIGYFKCDEFRHFKRLRHKLSNEEFAELFLDEDGVLKAYAFLGLMEQNDKRCFKFLIETLGNHQKIRVRYFDLNSEWYLADLLISIVYEKLSKEQIAILNNTVIENKLHNLSYYEFLMNEHGFITF